MYILLIFYKSCENCTKPIDKQAKKCYTVITVIKLYPEYIIERFDANEEIQKINRSYGMCCNCSWWGYSIQKNYA